MMNQKLLLLGLVFLSGISSAYLPPVYIANPETGECRYYFAGDERHFNPLPNGTWRIVGISGNYGENRSICQEFCMYYTVYKPQGRVWKGLICDCLGSGENGCENWCKINNAVWVKDDSMCKCQIGMEWKPDTGCVKSKNYSKVIAPCLREISDILIKLNEIEKQLNQSKRYSESIREEFKKIREEFSKLKEEDTQEHIRNLDRMLSEFEFMINSDSDEAMNTIGNLKEELSAMKIEQFKKRDNSALWLCAGFVILAMILMYYLSGKR